MKIQRGWVSARREEATQLLALSIYELRGREGGKFKTLDGSSAGIVVFLLFFGSSNLPKE